MKKLTESEILIDGSRWGLAGLSKNQATWRYDNETVNFTKQPSTNIE